MIERLLRGRGTRATEALETRRLRLVAMTAELLEAEAGGSLSTALGVQVGGDWPPELWEPAVRAHVAAEMRARPETVGWCRYVVQRARPAVLVGAVGAFRGAAGDVELAYSVVASRQRGGIATEAAGALVNWLLRLPAVHSVSAQAYVSRPASVKVMERCGMRLVGPGDEAETVRYRRWRH